MNYVFILLFIQLSPVYKETIQTCVIKKDN